MAFVVQRSSGFHMGSWNEKAEKYANMATWQMPMAYVVPQPWLIHFGPFI